MIRADKQHKKQVVNILTESFNNNKSVNYVVKQDNRRVKRISSLMEYAFEQNVNLGEIYLSDDQQGALVLVMPGKSRGIVASIYLTLRLITKVISIERLIKILKWKSKTNKYLPKTPFIYIDFIGVLPQRQRGGIGGKLLKKAIERSRETNLPIYLITSMPENLPFYNLFNFEVYQQIDFGYKIYFLRRLVK